MSASWWPGSLLGGGCTAASPPVALEQARTAYAQAQQTPQVVTQAPVALQEADQALRRAERVWADDHDTEEVQHLAYLTTQRVAIAQKVMEKKLAEVSIQELNQESDRVVLAHAPVKPSGPNKRRSKPNSKPRPPRARPRQRPPRPSSYNRNSPPSRRSRPTGAWCSRWAMSSLRRARRTSALARCVISIR